MSDEDLDLLRRGVVIVSVTGSRMTNKFYIKTIGIFILLCSADTLLSRIGAQVIVDNEPPPLFGRMPVIPENNRPDFKRNSSNA
jgi:hypothetical protein